MRTWTKTAGLLFWAVSAVYSDQVIGVEAATRVNPAPAAPTTEVKLLTDNGDPFANAGGAAAPAADATTRQGRSVSESEVKMSDAGTVEIHVNDADLVEVLRMLSLQSQRNIIASKDVRGTVTANLYDVTVREALDAILRANGYAYKEEGNFIYVYTAKEMAEIEKANRRMKTEVFRLHYSSAASVISMIKPVLSADSQSGISVAAVGGLESSISDVGADSYAQQDMIVITDYEENLGRVRELIKEIDQRPQQILVEAVIMRASLTDNNSLGVDFTVLGGVNFNEIEGNPTQGRASALNGNLTQDVGGNEVGATNYGGAGTNFPRATNGLKVGLVYDDIAVFINALESVTDTVVMANPKVLALNKQRAEVHVGSRDGYLTTTTTESSTVQTVEFLETGTKLMFRPFVGNDGYIRMEVHPEDSSGDVVAGLPKKSTTEITTNVLVKDGHTIVIGGLFREQTSSTRQQVPLLGNVPVLGNLFRQQDDSNRREEVIILLTPHIVKDDAAYAKASEEELANAEKVRVGIRKGMMWFSRERLAESCYENALKEMKKPNPNTQTAMWHLNCATNLNPQFVEAIHMKEQLTGREITSVDHSTIRYFVRNQILSELNAPAPTTAPAAATTRPAVELGSGGALLPATTQPVAEAVPATQPVAQAPSTQPVADAPAAPVEQTVELVEAPSTQPVAAMEIEAPIESTGTQELPTVVTVLEDDSSAAAGGEHAPATQPAMETAGVEQDFIVTELPSVVEELPMAEQDQDGASLNK